MNAFLLALATAVLYFLATGSNLEILYRLANLSLLVLVASYAWTQVSLRKVKLERKLQSPRSQVGDRLRETLTLANGSRLPRPWVAVYDHSSLPDHRASKVVTLRGLASESWEVETVCSVRGRFRLGPATLRAGDPFGLFQRKVVVGKPTPVVVYPATAPLPGFPLPGGALLGGANQRLRTDQVTTNAAGIREYVPGDAFNRIHWLSTARANRLMVKEFEPDPVADLWIALDMFAGVQLGEWPENTEEYAVHAAASIARHFLDGGWAVGLLASGAQHHDLPPERGDRQLLKILEELAVIHADGRQPLGELLIAEGLRFGRRATVIVITPSADTIWISALRTFTERGVRSLAVVLDRPSFGGTIDSTETLTALAAAGVRGYVYRRGHALADVFLGAEAAAMTIREAPGA